MEDIFLLFLLFVQAEVSLVMNAGLMEGAECGSGPAVELPLSETTYVVGHAHVVALAVVVVGVVPKVFVGTAVI